MHCFTISLLYVTGSEKTDHFVIKQFVQYTGIDIRSLISNIYGTEGPKVLPIQGHEVGTTPRCIVRYLS